MNACSINMMNEVLAFRNEYLKLLHHHRLIALTTFRPTLLTSASQRLEPGEKKKKNYKSDKQHS